MIFYFVVEPNKITVYDNITLPQLYREKYEQFFTELKELIESDVMDLKTLPKGFLLDIKRQIDNYKKLNGKKLFRTSKNPTIYAFSLMQLTGISKVIDKTVNKVLRSHPKPQFKTLKQLMQHLQKQYNAKQITLLNENCILINNRVKVWIKPISGIFYVLEKDKVVTKKVEGFKIVKTKGKP